MDLPIFSSRDSFYKKPFGAVQTGTEVSFTVCLPLEYTFSEVKLHLFSDTVTDEVTLSYQKTEQDRLFYHCDWVAKTPEVYFYNFSVSHQGAVTFIKKDPDGFGYIASGGADFQLTVYKKEYRTPDWIKGGVIYQIFPDRFCRSGEAKEAVPEDRILRSDWGGMPYFLPNEHGEILNDDYFGGDLAGIAEKLPYLKSLGVTLIYLNPIFEAHSSHRYNTADYTKIDPLLGNEESFRELCKKARKLGIRVILDGVFSHTGSDSVYFNKNGRYPEEGAYNSTESKYYSWYQFSKFPYEYKSWWGFSTLPEVVEEEPSFCEFICGENGVIRSWLRAGASGFRLDVADELPDSFIEKIRAAVKAEGDDKLLIGEVWEDASNKEGFGKHRRYFLGDELDSVMNYPFKDAVLAFMNTLNKTDFIRRIYSIVENYPPASLNTAMNSLSTHDTERAINILVGKSAEGKDRVWQSHHMLTTSEYALGKNKLKAAMAIQYFLPGVPCLYYGDEAGLQGYKDPFNRCCFPWGNEDEELTNHARLLGDLRQKAPALAEGDITFLDTPNSLLAFIRKDSSGESLIVVNPSGEPQNYSLPEKYSSYRCLHGEYNKGLLNLKPYDFALLKN